MVEKIKNTKPFLSIVDAAVFFGNGRKGETVKR
jgi:hypothetical protein